MFAEIQAALGSARVLSDLLKSAKELADFNQAAATAAELNIKLMAVMEVALAGQEKQAALTRRIGELEEALVKAEGRKAEAERYQLHAFGPTGALAYAVKPGMERGEPPHYLCAACMDQGKTSKLQPFRRISLRCPQCSGVIQTDHAAPVSPVVRIRRLRDW